MKRKSTAYASTTPIPSPPTCSWPCREKQLDKPNANAPFIATGSQTFRECTFIAHGEVTKNYKDKATIVTKAQWDDVVLKYFHRIAKNLQEHGWLDKVHILIDESSNVTRLENLLSLLKSDPLTAQIQVIACVQGSELITEMKEDNPSQRRFDGLIDTLVPQFDESYDRWMDYYFDDYNISRNRKSLWQYYVVSSRLAIDAPGINNRITGLGIFRRGASGLLIWETFGWQHMYGESQNPWKDPLTVHANGSLAYFYPPSRSGPASKPNWTITPSLRLETFRESVTDYDYAMMLEELMTQAKAKNIDTSNANVVRNDIDRLFNGHTNWTQNDAWYLDLRQRMADAIVTLRHALK
ncbi:MAG: DUF4091 domain-containing protein [Phycisphaeraceae bacterium]|nr:DUF4091 domain-containing protein [Phycisphaeraceae bacterium]